MDIAVASAGCWVQLDATGEMIASARIVLGAVAATPVLAKSAAEFLANKPATEASFVQAGELAKEVAKPINDMRGTIEYRVHLAGVLTKRMLALAVDRARSR
jgi:carbon-monoxide dehydrogenase medium subunit